CANSRLATGSKLIAISYQLSAISYQLLALSLWPAYCSRSTSSSAIGSFE
ncbi:MAG: hypothetical protein F6K44_32415, partial [Moorea sp. SIO3E2]|nr:hypothetical protein [Moorena sp. SIO3E2]